MGDADAAGLGQTFKPGGDVDAVAKGVVTVDDDIADVDADPKLDALLWRDAGVPRCHLLLHFSSTAGCVHNAAELDQEAVAGGLNYASFVLRDLGVDQLAAQRPQPPYCADLMIAHQPAIPRDIGRKNCREPALHSL
jgi:hypothetical protein